MFIRKSKIPKLVARIKGGLGNQLFCYAAARSLAIRNNAELVIDNITGFVRDSEYRRGYRLDGFAINARLANRQEMFFPFERIRRGLVKARNRRLPFYQRSYIEQEFPDFDDRLLQFRLCSRVTTIDGLWQSQLYFTDIEEILRADLQIIPPEDEHNKYAAQLIKGNNVVGIHIRYFSYFGNLANVPLEYYRNALFEIKKRINNPYFVIFSDYPQAAKEVLDLPEKQTLLVDWNTGVRGELSDLWLMTKCQHFVISNSTFSWWGAWLGARNYKRLVLFPRCVPQEAIRWSWDYQGQMPISWIPILATNKVN